MVVGVLLPMGALHAVGITPSTIVVHHVLPTQRIVRTVSLSVPSSVRAQTFAVSAQGSGATLIELSSGRVVVAPETTKVDYAFTIAPLGAAQGAYEASVIFADIGKHATVQAQVQARVEFSVGAEERRAFSIENVSLENTEVAQAVPVHFTVRNSGNTNVRLDKMVLTLRQRTGLKNSIESVIPVSEIPVIPPFTTQALTVYSTSSFSQGSYDGMIEFFEDNKKQAVFRNLSVRVYPATPLAHGSKFLEVHANKTKVKRGETVQVMGTLKNFSQASLKPVLYAVVLRNGVVADVLRSATFSVEQGKEAQVTVPWRPRRTGTYTLDTYFTYGPYETEHKELVVEVGDATPLLITLIYVALALLACMLGVLLLRSWREWVA